MHCRDFDLNILSFHDIMDASDAMNPTIPNEIHVDSVCRKKEEKTIRQNQVKTLKTSSFPYKIFN